jgi:hypothetical protein
MADTDLQEYRANASFGTPSGTVLVDHVYLIDPTQFADLIDAGYLEPAETRSDEAPALVSGTSGITAAPVETLTTEPTVTEPTPGTAGTSEPAGVAPAPAPPTAA